MTEILNQRSIVLEDETSATVTYFLLRDEEKFRSYGLRAEIEVLGQRVDEAEARNRFATREEAVATAKFLLEEAVTPVTLNDII